MQWPNYTQQLFCSPLYLCFLLLLYSFIFRTEACFVPNQTPNLIFSKLLCTCAGIYFQGLGLAILQWWFLSNRVWGKKSCHTITRNRGLLNCIESGYTALGLFSACKLQNTSSIFCSVTFSQKQKHKPLLEYNLIVLLYPIILTQKVAKLQNFIISRKYNQ